METELCPVCGESVEDCPSVLVDGLGKFPRYRLSCEVRRAEIGALVERIVESHQRRVDCVRLEGRGYCAHSPSSKPPPTSPSLLDALRVLAREVSGDA